MTAPRFWWQTRWFALAAVLLAAVPLIWPTIPPLTDLPGHIARYRVMQGDDILGQWYAYNWKPAGNLGVDLLVYLLAPLIGLEPAVKIVIFSIPPLTVAAMLWLSHEAHGRVDPLALFALPIAYNHPFHFGFVNYALGMALAFGAFALWLRLRPRITARAIAFVPIASLVWLAHMAAWGALGLFAFAAEVMRHRDLAWPQRLIRAGIGVLPLTLPMVFMVVWRAPEGAGITEGFFNFVLKAGWIGMIFRDRWIWLDLASVLVLLLVIYRSLRVKRSAWSPTLALGALLLLIAFIATPFMLMGSAYADTRMAPYLIAAIILALHTGASIGARERSIVALIGLAFFATRIAATTWSYALYDRSWTHHLTALDRIPIGTRVATFVGEPCLQSWSAARTHHLPGMVTARRTAFTNSTWIFANAPLSVTVTGLGGYENDPSQIVQPAPCDIPTRNRPIAMVLRAFPRHGFDYVWLIDLPTPGPFPADLQPVWRNGTDWLLKIDHRRSPPHLPLSSSPARP